MASSNPYADLGAEPIEDFSDLGAEPVAEETPAPAAAQPAAFADLGAEPVEPKKDVNFFEGIKTFTDNMKAKLEQLALQHQQAEQAAQAQKAAEDADPKNWSSSRFSKEAPKPTTPEEQAIFDATIQEKKLNEENLRKQYWQQKYGFDPEEQQKEFAGLMGPDVKIEAMKPQSFFDKIKNGVAKLYQPNNAKSANILNLANYTGAPIPVVQKHYDEITKELGLRNYPDAAEIINAGMVLALPVSVEALGPLAVARGIAGYTAAKEGTERLILPAGKAVFDSMRGEKPKYEVTKLQELFPEGMKDVGQISEFVLYGSMAKGFDELLAHPEVVKGGQRVLGEIAGLRFRILKAMGVKQPTALEPITYEQAQKLYPENWKDIISQKEWGRYKTNLTEKVTSDNATAEAARVAGEKPTVSAETLKDLGAAPVEAPKFDVPEFKSSNEAMDFGKAVLGNPEAITHLQNARDEITPKIEELKTKTDPASFQEGYNLATKRQFINEALRAAGAVEPTPTPAPAATASPTPPKGKKTAIFDVPDQDSIKGLVGDITDMEAKRRLPVEDIHGEMKTLVTGFIPDYLQNIGVTKAKDIPLLEKALAGEPITAKQEVRIRDLVSRHQEFMGKVYGDEARAYYRQKAEELNADAEREIGASKGVDNQIGEGSGALTKDEQDTLLQSAIEEAKSEVLSDALRRGVPETTGKPLAGSVSDQIDFPFGANEPKPPSGTGFAAPAQRPQKTAGRTGTGEKAWQPKVLPAEKLAKLPPTLGGMEYVRALEMPELVRLAREISGNLPKVVKQTGRAYGRFIGRPGDKGTIKLIADIFKDPELAAGVLAHEIGHNIDWLPDETLSRGNVIGRAISSVGKYMKQTFGPNLFDPDHPTELNAKDLRKELEALTTWWHPFTPVKGSSYTKYRYSSSELYAEFLSVLLNAPAKAQEMAPKFYNAFFEHLDKKPEVRQSFFDIQDLLNDPKQVLKSREGDIVNMFEKSRAQFENLLNQKEAGKKSLRFLLKYHFVDRNAAILEARKKVAASGGPINPEEDPKYLLEENSLIGSFIKSHLDDFDPIYHDLEKSGLDFDQDFGQYLFLKRVMADRAQMANPLGHNPETAGRQLEALKQRLGPERFEELEGYVDRARDWFKSVNDLLKEDILSPEQKKMVDENNDYAPFRVTKYLKEYATARFAHQMGTLNDIENPGASMLLKGVAMLRLYKRNLIEKNTMKFLQDSGDAEPATVQTYDGQVHVKEKEGKDIVKWRDGGKWHAAYVDPFIADSFKYDDSGQLQTVGEVFNKILLNNDLFRPLYITFNLGFQSFNLIKDFMRSWKNTPDLTFAGAVKNYAKAAPHAVARVKGKLDPLVQQMEREGALNITMNDMMMGKESDDTEIDALMAKYGLREEEKKTNPLLLPIKKILDGIKFAGDVIETIPKVAGFYAREDMPAQQRAYEIRNYVGTPNFKRKGKMFPIYNSLLLFSNIFKEGLRSDSEVAFRNPKTRSGFWWKTIKANILPKIIMGLGAAGLLGKAVKDNYDKQTEYDKTNYITVPIGEDERGKAIYVRIPQDETGRLISGLFWKTFAKGLGAATGQDIGGGEAQDLLAFTGGQLPSMSPALNLMTTWGEYLTGGDPKDNFRSQSILTDDERKAGGLRSLEPMMRWTVNQSGLVHMDIRDRLKDETLAEKTLAMTPILNRFLRVTDYGEVEDLKKVLSEQQSAEANKRLDTKDVINDSIRKGLSPAEAAKAVPAEDRKAFMKKYAKTENRVGADPIEQALGQATSNAQKLQVLEEVAGNYASTSEYRKALIPYYKSKTISLPVLNDAVRGYNQKNKGTKS